MPLRAVTRREIELPAAEYIDRFRTPDAFAEACRACPAYGQTWACLPFDFDIEARLRGFPTVRIIGCTFPLPPGAEADFDSIAPIREHLNTGLLALESELGGLACAFGGSCRICPQCTRPQGLPCCHPDRMRPSLEAYGFDITRTLADLLGITLRWGPRLKEITLVGAVFYG